MSQRNSADTVLARLCGSYPTAQGQRSSNTVVPQWELRVTKNGMVEEHERCGSFPALIAESTTARVLTGAIRN